MIVLAQPSGSLLRITLNGRTITRWPPIPIPGAGGGASSCSSGGVCWTERRRARLRASHEDVRERH